MTSEPPPETRRGPRAWLVAGLHALTVKQAAFGVFLVVLLVSLPFGGMRAAAKPELTVLKKDKAIAATPFTITYKGAWQTDDVGDLSATPKLTDGSRYLIVGVKVRTAAEASVPFDILRQSVALVGVRGLTRQGTFDARPERDSRNALPDPVLVDADFHTMGSLPPRLTYGLYFIWRQSPGEPVPDELEVLVRSTTYRKSSLDGVLGYFDPVERARGTFPVATWQPLRSTPVDVNDGSS